MSVWVTEGREAAGVSLGDRVWLSSVASVAPIGLDSQLMIIRSENAHPVTPLDRFPFVRLHPWQRMPRPPGRKLDPSAVQAWRSGAGTAAAIWLWQEFCQNRSHVGADAGEDDADRHLEHREPNPRGESDVWDPFVLSPEPDSQAFEFADKHPESEVKECSSIAWGAFCTALEEIDLKVSGGKCYCVRHPEEKDRFLGLYTFRTLRERPLLESDEVTGLFWDCMKYRMLDLLPKRRSGQKTVLDKAIWAGWRKGKEEPFWNATRILWRAYYEPAMYYARRAWELEDDEARPIVEFAFMAAIEDLDLRVSGGRLLCKLEGALERVGEATGRKLSDGEPLSPDAHLASVFWAEHLQPSVRAEANARYRARTKQTELEGLATFLARVHGTANPKRARPGAGSTGTAPEFDLEAAAGSLITAPDDMAVMDLVKKLAAVAELVEGQGRAILIATNLYIMLKMAQPDGRAPEEIVSGPLPNVLVDEDLLAALPLLAGKSMLNGRLRGVAARGPLGDISKLAASGQLAAIAAAVLPVDTSPRSNDAPLANRIKRLVSQIIELVEETLAVWSPKLVEQIEELHRSVDTADLDLPRFEWGGFLQARLFDGDEDRRNQAVSRCRRRIHELLLEGIEGHNG